MTLVVGLIHEGEVWMGSDSANSCDNQQDLLAAPKHFRKGEFLIGCAGTQRAAQIAQYHLQLPEQQEGQDTMEFMARDVVDAVRACFIEHDCVEQEKGATQLDANILLAYRRRLFAIHASWQLIEVTTPYHTIGSAYPNANGALYALQQAVPHMAPQRQLEIVLEAAAQQVMDVAPPFHIEKL